MSSKDKAEMDQIIKTTQRILNQVTPENFDLMLPQMCQLELQDDDDRINAVTKVFGKAADESMAASCARLFYSIVKHHTDIQSSTAKKFRKFILDSCQQEFQKTSTEESCIKQLEDELANAPEDKKEQLTLELVDKRFHMRRKKLGNVRFIGELYKLQMLTPRIMVECVHMLLGREDQDENKSDEESIECLCKLLTTVGEILENQLNDLVNKSKSAGQQSQLRFVPEPKWMDGIFNKLRGLSRDNKLSSVIRFGLLDVIELRENNWKPRRDATGPKTIAEVRRDAARQEAEEKQRIQALPDVQQGRRANMNIPLSTRGKKGSETKTSTIFQQQQQRNIGSQVQVLGPPWGWGLRPGSSSFNQNAPPPVLGPPSGWGLRPGSSSFNQNLPPRLQKKQGESPGRNNSTSSPEGGDQRRPGFPGPGGSVPHLGPQRMPTLDQNDARANDIDSQGPSDEHVKSNQTQVAGAHSAVPVEARQYQEISDTQSAESILHHYLVNSNFENAEDLILSELHEPDGFEKLFSSVVELVISATSKEPERRGAAELIKALVESDRNAWTFKDIVAAVQLGIMQDISTTVKERPKAALHLTAFLAQVFSDQPRFSWVAQLASGLEDAETFNLPKSLEVLRNVVMVLSSMLRL